MKSSVIFILTLLAFFFIGAVAMQDIPQNITLDGAKKGAVEFPHVLHHEAGYTCQTCHHNMPEDAEIPDQGCRECHTKEHKINAMKAFHTTCLTCHREENKEKKADLPVKCNDCHVPQ